MLAGDGRSDSPGHSAKYGSYSILDLTCNKIVDFNPLNPIVHFWLHHTAHCAQKIVSARLRAGSASAERVGQGEVGGVTGRVLCTWWLLGLALKRPWLVPGGPPHTLTAWTGLENTTVHMVAARLGFEKTMVGTRWATPRPDCMDRLRKHYCAHGGC